ncbi:MULTISPECIES: aldose epimerase family protein [Burkholderia]|uniref:Aldose epimerase n=2 Tax=Burkholderia contaminans TaxID=488447 RepID=A0A1E3FNT9_9BURK|nr:MULTISPECIES: aldose epimerase [Burkholderia]UTP21052.1 aldose epimerase [Burkholderia sp. FXe9]KKL40270.1 aldose epimerase [Burkholderia contaminans LMG 23361]MBA9831405.1 aldose epimerase [Burkholderia contaminans]MBA9840115.1 aldose epimerase [Burkholderia contaminans]MBA9863503.1 aldose epimerase [Burkholderia contaminans]
MPTFQQHDIHELHAGPSLVRVAPQFGGRLLSWDVDGEPVIFWPDTADWSNLARVRGGNPLLFPFLGRHRVDGELGRWRDATGVVRDLPMHGFARDLPFAARPSADGAALSMTLDATDALRASYPFDFRFEATYRLADSHTLEVALTTTNRGDTPLPYYAGHHFYFALPHGERAETTLELPPTHRCAQQADGSISTPEPGEARYRLDNPDIVDRFHCLDGVPATPVRIVMPGRRRTIEIALDVPGSIPWYAVTTWTEKPDSDFYCVEPWLGLPDAIHNGLGLRMLAPGATETATLRIRVLPLAG